MSLKSHHIPQFIVVYKSGYRIVDTKTNQFADNFIYSYAREAIEEAHWMNMRVK